MKRPHARSRRRRPPILEPYEVLPLEEALQILELLAARPLGLTIPEIVAHFHNPSRHVIRTIALMQQRQWLRTNSHGDRLMIGDRLIGLSGAR